MQNYFSLAKTENGAIIIKTLFALPLAAMALVTHIHTCASAYDSLYIIIIISIFFIK